MMFFARAVVTGFGLSLGGALFKKIAPKLGLGEEAKKKIEPDIKQQDAATDPQD